MPNPLRTVLTYDPEVGTNLTLVLHGNGLDHRWTFWNQPEREFRPDDLVVSPDGTMPHAGTGANECPAGASDIARVKALIVELKAVWNVRQVFLYGHSQGAFFVFHSAGAEPELVDGVVGHAGGVDQHGRLARAHQDPHSGQGPGAVPGPRRGLARGAQGRLP